MSGDVTVTQADREFAADWNYECRHCSEYEGDFEADLASAVAEYREQAVRERAGLVRQSEEPHNCARCAAEWSAYMDEAVSKAPEPLRALGEHLTSILDDDQWKSAERYLNAAVLARHRLAALADAQGEAVGWLYERRGVQHVTSFRWANTYPDDPWTETPLYAHPPASPTAEVVEALRRYADQFCELGPYTEACGKLEWDQCSGCLARTALAKHERTTHD